MCGIRNKNSKKMQFTQTVDVMKDKKHRVAHASRADHPTN